MPRNTISTREEEDCELVNMEVNLQDLKSALQMFNEEVIV